MAAHQSLANVDWPLLLSAECRSALGSHGSPAALARTEARLHWLARKPGCIDGHRHGTFAFGSIGPLPAACKPSLASGGDECIGSLSNARQPPLYAELLL